MGNGDILVDMLSAGDADGHTMAKEEETLPHLQIRNYKPILELDKEELIKIIIRII